MGECYLLCNTSKCRKELVTQAWITSCSHAFCLEHGENIMSSSNNAKCPACGNSIMERYDMVLQDLNPTEQFKSMVLVGLTPEKVLEIANRSIIFWTYQMHQERLYKNAVVKSSKEHAASLKDYIENVVTGHKVEVQKMNRNIEIMKKEMDDKVIKVEELVSQLAEKSRHLKNLQNKFELLKRKTAIRYVSPTQDMISSPYSVNPEFDPRISHSKQYDIRKDHSRRGPPVCQTENIPVNNHYSKFRPSSNGTHTSSSKSDFNFQPVSNDRGNCNPFGRSHD